MVNEPSFVLNDKLGGMNWAYCNASSGSGNGKDGKGGNMQIQKYLSIVTTSTLKDSETK